MKRLSLFRKSSSAPESSKQQQDDRFCARTEVVDWLEKVFDHAEPPVSLTLSLPSSTSGSSSPNVSSRRSSKSMMSLLSSPRFLSPLSSRKSANNSEESLDSSSSPRVLARDSVVKWLSAVLERDEEETRTLEQLRAGARDENNVHRDRDLVVLCLSNNSSNSSSSQLKRGSKLMNRSFGSVQMPHKSVKSLEEALEARLGYATAASTGAKAFLSLWTPEFALSMLKATKSAAWDESRSVIGLVVHAVGLSGNLPQMIKLQMTLEIEEEQKKDTARGTLFRASSLATYVFSNVYHNGSEGLALLQYVCGPLVKSVMGLKAVLDFSETEKIRSLTSSFLAALDGSIASEVFPRSMIDVLQHLHGLICVKFASMNRSIMSLFLFVRFFCPAIVSPQVFGLAKDVPSTVQQKNLVLFSKLFSNLGSGIRFDGSKEDRMVQFNPLIDSLGVLAEQFFEKIAIFNLSTPVVGKTSFGFLRSGSEKHLDMSSALYVYVLEHANALLSDSSIDQDDKEKIRVMLSLEN